MSRDVVAEHKAVVPVDRDDRLVCVVCVDVDKGDVPVVKKVALASIGGVRQSRDVVEMSIIDVHGERKCVRVDKKRVQVDLESVPVSRDDVSSHIDVVRPQRNRVSGDIEDVSADEDADPADMIVVNHDRDDVDDDMDVVDVLLNVDQVDVDVVDVDRDGVDPFENNVSRGKNVAFVEWNATSWSTIAVPSDRGVLDGLRDALDVDIERN